MGEFLLKEQWQIDNWNKNDCSIEECTDGGYIVLCHQIQTPVYSGTLEECRDFLGISEKGLDYFDDWDDFDSDIDGLIEDEHFWSSIPED